MELKELISKGAIEFEKNNYNKALNIFKECLENFDELSLYLLDTNSY